MYKKETENMTRNKGDRKYDEKKTVSSINGVGNTGQIQTKE